MFCSRILTKIINLTCYKSTPSNTMFSDIKSIFQSSILAVQPQELIRNSIHFENDMVEIQGKKFLLNKNVYIIGFGKAVFGMAFELENLLRSHVISGILSVPVGLKYNIFEKSQGRFSSKFKVIEGAENNMPDCNSEQAAVQISELAASLGSSDILFVLISGGGSALLPYPKPPLTLNEKKQVIQLLASKGATINELNMVRKKLSILKGGGLAELAKPAKIISLILSDIIEDPLELIASGPTVGYVDDSSSPLKIVQKYEIEELLPESARALLLEKTHKNIGSNDVHNFIIGNNTVALKAAAQKAWTLLYKPFILTNKLSGMASAVGPKIIQLIDSALKQDENKIKEACVKLNIDYEKLIPFMQGWRSINKDFKGFCILFGGETTVEVRGTGIGGRNQELALAASLELHKLKHKNSIVLLSAGTDGIDGPTDAAGALAASSVVEDAYCENINPESFMQKNDSFTFYETLAKGQYHLKIGHTGTNVMDIIIVLIQK